MKNYKYFLDSRTADVKNDASYKFNLLDSIDHQGKKVMVKLRSLTVPFNYQQINNTNNDLVVNYNLVSYNITLSNGNYSTTQLALEISGQINNVIGAGALTVQYNTPQNKYIFTNNTANQIEIIFNNYENVALCDMVGVLSTGIIINPLSYLVAPEQTLLQPVSHYFVKLTNMRLKHNYNSKGYGNQLLEKIEVNDVPDNRYSHFYYTDNFHQELVSNGYINSIDLELVDNFNRKVLFNNDKYYILFCLEFQISD